MIGSKEGKGSGTNRTRVVNIREEDYDVYIGRAGRGRVDTPIEHPEFYGFLFNLFHPVPFMEQNKDYATDQG